uniref:Uncharacterized protein n=1 Tax=Ananas comosus var. bracteatus TaxID=296719 RepID=A0A6V7NQI3_ANACO|nr:unnamed protein product [Ananas comosus var. bracteatus]
MALPLLLSSVYPVLSDFPYKRGVGVVPSALWAVSFPPPHVFSCPVRHGSSLWFVGFHAAAHLCLSVLSLPDFSSLTVLYLLFLCLVIINTKGAGVFFVCTFLFRPDFEPPVFGTLLLCRSCPVVLLSVAADQ